MSHHLPGHNLFHHKQQHETNKTAHKIQPTTDAAFIAAQLAAAHIKQHSGIQPPQQSPSHVPYKDQDPLQRSLATYHLTIEDNTIEGTNQNINKALLHAFDREDQTLLDALLKDPVIINKQLMLEGHKDCTLLHVAARYNNKRAFDQIFPHFNSNIDITSTDGYTPLHFAAANDHSKMITHLLHLGADINIKARSDALDDRGYSPLHVAVHRDYVHSTNTLLRKGANVNITDVAGWTCLHLAARYGQMEMVKVLVEHGAKVDMTTDVGRTALHLAAVQGNVEIVKYLLSRGAMADTSATDGLTPLMAAKEGGQGEVVKVLEVHASEGSLLPIM